MFCEGSPHLRPYKSWQIRVRGCVNEGGDRDAFVKEGPSLKALQELVDRGKRGYFWDNG